VRFAVTTVTIAEVLFGPLSAGDEALARRYRAVLETWRVVLFDAEAAVRLRLNLPDAIQAASALAISAAAPVTHDRDFDRLKVTR
jgi:predicted nucleic acid-binding protein